MRLSFKIAIMKKHIVLTFFLFLSLNLFCQKNQNSIPFIIKGQIIEYDIIKYTYEKPTEKNRTVTIIYSDQFNETHFDTINLDRNGKFFYKTYKFSKLQRINLFIPNKRILQIFAAPGFDLTFSTGINSTNSFTKLTGKGSETYKYDSILSKKGLSNEKLISEITLDKSEFINAAVKEQRYKDSLLDSIFNQSRSPDNYFASIKRILHLENFLAKLKAFHDFGTFKNNGDYSFSDNYFDKEYLDNPGRDEYLASELFRNEVRFEDAYYLNYILRHQNQKDTVSKSVSIEHKLKEASKIFKGEVRSFIAYNLMSRLPRNFSSIDNFNRYRNQITPYFPYLSEPYKEKIESNLTKQQEIVTKNEDAVAAKEAEKALSFIGKPAPSFELKSNTDQIYSLADFKGKVVILNLWSSWCDLCRNENKAFNKLFQKYKDDQRIAFISIAVFDTFEGWQRVLKEDKPEGIQLIDKDRAVLNSYISEHVPKFILIDKEGNVVNFMAPKPGRGDELEKLIKKELEKKS